MGRLYNAFSFLYLSIIFRIENNFHKSYDQVFDVIFNRNLDLFRVLVN